MLIPKFPRNPKLIRISKSARTGLQDLANQFGFVSPNGTPRISDIIEAIGLQRFRIITDNNDLKVNKESTLIRVSKPAQRGLEILSAQFKFTSSQGRSKVSEFLEAVGQKKLDLIPIDNYDIDDEWYKDGYEDGYWKEDARYDTIAEAMDIEKTNRDYCLYMAGYFYGLHKRLLDEKG